MSEFARTGEWPPSITGSSDLWDWAPARYALIQALEIPAPPSGNVTATAAITLGAVSVAATGLLVLPGIGGCRYQQVQQRPDE